MRIIRLILFIVLGACTIYIFTIINHRVEFLPIKTGLEALKNGDFQKALNHFSKYLILPAPENKTTLECIVKLGVVFWNLDRLEEAKEQFFRAEALAQKLHLTEEQKYCQTALSINDLYLKGRECYFKGDLEKSILLFRDAVKKARLIKSPAHELKISKAWSMALLSKSGSREFLDLSQRSLLLAQSIQHHREIIGMLNNIGSFYSIKNEYSNALIYHLKSLQAAKEYDEAKEMITALSNVSADHLAMGNVRKAFASISEAINLAKATRNEKINTDLLMNMGSSISLRAFITNDSDEYGHAIQCFQEALNQFQKNKDNDSILLALSEIGDVYINMQQYERARAYIEDCFKLLSPKSDRHKIAGLWNQRGVIELSLGDSNKAEVSFKHALDIEQYDDLTITCFRSNYGLAKCYERRGMIDSAMTYYSKAIEQIGLIGSIINNDIDRANFLQNKTAIYQSYVNYCYRLFLERRDERYGRKLFEVIEMAKARSFTEYMEKRQLGNMPLRFSIEDAQKSLLDNKTALLEYFIGESASYLITITKTTFRTYDLPKRSAFTDSVIGYLYYCGLPKLSRSFGERAEIRLYKELIAPALAELPRPIEHLIIVPDGILYRLPFEALLIENSNVGEERYLIEKYSVSYAPSAASLKILLDRIRPGNYSKDLLAIGAPEYNKPISPNAAVNNASDIVQHSFSESEFKISPLLYSKEEIKGISALFRPEKRSIYLGKAARKQILKSISPGDYRIIHVACHAFSDEIDPYRSVIAFSPANNNDDGFLQLKEMYDLQLKCDLIVLSACQTGKGNIVTNEGVLGLPRVFFYTGASSVVSSLWDIDDRATAQFMVSFYQKLQEGQTKAQSLRSAKIEFIKSNKYSHPFFWSAFVLTGDYSSINH